MRLEYGTEFQRDIRLHQENRLRTIHSSLAIEGNSLSLGEIRSVIEGKLVVGSQSEIKEVKNAYEAYDAIMTFDPYSVDDFLEAHRLMTESLVPEAGEFRSGDVGVFDGESAIHIGARPQFIHGLVTELFAWAKASELHPILKSAILHYEIEIIHPFADGNGRMGRLWQTLVLAKWKSLFAWMPMESVLYQNRAVYHQAIQDSKYANDSGQFIEFTLSALHDTITVQEQHQVRHQVEHQVEQQVDLSDTQLAVLRSLENVSLSRKDIFAAVGLSGDSRSFKRHIEPLITSGFVEMTIPDKPKSRLQKYRLTKAGKQKIHASGS